MNVQDIIQELQTLGNEAIKKVLVRHGAREPIFGVKVEDLKKIQKRIKVHHALALELYDTGISDAMYLAGLIADDRQMTKKVLQKWVKAAPWSMIGEYTVPWVAAGSPHGHELALEWIDSKKESIAASGWCTWAGIVAVTPDEQLDLKVLRMLLQRVEKTIHEQPHRVRYTMNGFLIAVGSYVAPLTKEALATAKRVGKVTVDMGGTACKVPSAAESIQKMADRGSIGKKRKVLKC